MRRRPSMHATAADIDMNVAQYLKLRLEQLGLDRLFGVAGNYTAPFLNTILADRASPMPFPAT